MGTALLVYRLAVRDIRRRPVQAFLLLLAIATGATTLTLGLALQGTTNNPYARTRAATNGPDAVATLLPDSSNGSGPATEARPGGPSASNGSGPADVSKLVALEQASGVVAHSGPFRVVWTPLRAVHTTGVAEVEGRSSAPSPVDQPKLLQGGWVRPGGVVLEAGFASALGLHVGDGLSLGGTDVRVVGTAVSAAIPDYPASCTLGCFLTGSLSGHDPGVVWAAEADAEHIAPAAGDTPAVYYLNLKLQDPAGAATFADRANASAAPTAPLVFSWQAIRDKDAQEIAKVQLVLYTGSWLLALLALASVAVLVGGRMAEQTRRVGLLKAVGGTPRLVAVVLLFEHALVSLCAAGVGLAVGWLAAPLISRPGAGLVGAPSAPSLGAATIGFVVALALGVAVVATFVPAIRAARQSTVAALEDAARAPRRRASVIRLSAHLPVSLLLGARLVARRPRRVLLNVFSIAVTASGLMAVLIVHATVGAFLGPKLGEVTTVISVMLVILAGVNTVFVAWSTAVDTRHAAALARALGATPEQVTTGLSLAQVLPALVGALLGIPGGIAVYDAPKNGPGPTTIPSALWIVAMVAGMVLAVAVLTAIPTRIGSRGPAADTLRAEAT